MASADLIREAKKAGEPNGVLERYFREYALAHPLHADLALEIKDLGRDYGMNLSWYPD